MAAVTLAHRMEFTEIEPISAYFGWFLFLLAFIESSGFIKMADSFALSLFLPTAEYEFI